MKRLLKLVIPLSTTVIGGLALISYLWVYTHYPEIMSTTDLISPYVLIVFAAGALSGLLIGWGINKVLLRKKNDGPAPGIILFFLGVGLWVSSWFTFISIFLICGVLFECVNCCFPSW